MLLRIADFQGEIPKRHPRLLPDSFAQAAVDVRLEEGDLQPICHCDEITTYVGTAETIYRDRAGTWHLFDTDVDIHPGPVDTERLYITDGANEPRMRYNGTDYALALPAPTGGPTLSNLSATDPDREEDILYCYTWVTELGEESAPSPITTIVSDASTTVRISGFDATPAGRLIDRIRIYRSQTSSFGTSALYFVKELTLPATQYDHDVNAEPIQEELPTGNFTTPPDGLAGLTAMPNGMMAAFKGKKVYFCEPYQPHAWPEDYVLTVDYEIVGLASFGTSLAVMTEGTPYRMQGTNPANIVSEKLEVDLPCLSKRSIVDFGYSALYASPEGIALISADGADLVSRPLFSLDDWRGVQAETIFAERHASRYVFHFDGEIENMAESVGIIDLSGDQPFFKRYSIQPTAFFYDRHDASLYYARNGAIYQADSPNSDGLYTYRWKSQRFMMPVPITFGAILIEADEQDAKTATVRIYADGVKTDEFTVRPNEIDRLSAGFLARSWEIELEGDLNITAVHVAGDPSEILGG